MTSENVPDSGLEPRRINRERVMSSPSAALAGGVVVAVVTMVRQLLELMMADADEVREAVRRHVEAFWPGHPQEEFVWTLGPIEDRLPGFRVRRVAPVKRPDPWVYVTVGAANATDGDGMEFFILSPSESPEHVETLAMVANFHADSRYRLSFGRIINIGRPWMEGSVADHLLVSLPYSYGPSLEHCEAPGRHVQVLWLVPITAAEARYAQQQGLEALEQLLEQSGVDVITQHRPSLV